MADAALMAGKSVLVTGGTIGKATAIGLAALGARVGITGRDQVRTEAAAAGIRAAPGSPAVGEAGAQAGRGHPASIPQAGCRYPCQAPALTWSCSLPAGRA
jgi:NAD(P)-dependent dehydrogenase (short-subunit alcohol dehydrogenase family)